MRGKEEKKGREKEEKKRRKGGKKLGTKSQKKKKKKKEVRAHLFPLRSRHFLDQSEIGCLEKSTLYLLLFSRKIFSMNKLCDF